MSDAHYAIQLVSRMTGLSTHVIRIWEQRYRAVEPQRTPSNHRLYSEKDIERLGLLRNATHAGHNIGIVARLTNDELRALNHNLPEALSRTPLPPLNEPAADDLLKGCMDSVRSFDGESLVETLKRAGIMLGAQGVVQRLVAPLAQALGELWREGTVTAAQEHFATGHIRDFLGQLAKPFGGNAGGPSIVVATPAGQIHELGALLVVALASNLGWSVTNLGVDLPATEIAQVAIKKRARAVALSIVYPEDDILLPGELKLLRESLPKETMLLVGGRGMEAYRESLLEIRATMFTDLGQLGRALDDLRKAVKNSAFKPKHGNAA